MFLVGGKPLLCWTVKSAHESKRLSRVIVSTDSLEIAEAARTLATEVPFIRPQRLASDETSGIDVIVHALEWLSNTEAYEPDLVMVLQPTSPLRTADHIDGAIELLLAKNAPAVVSVTEVQYHPYWMKRVNGEGVMHDFMTLDAPYARRQDLPVLYAINGAVYLARRATFLAQRTFFPEGTRAFIMPQSSSLDIDTPWDAHLADLILRNAHEQRASD